MPKNTIHIFSCWLQNKQKQLQTTQTKQQNFVKCILNLVMRFRRYLPLASLLCLTLATLPATFDISLIYRYFMFRNLTATIYPFPPESTTNSLERRNRTVFFCRLISFRRQTNCAKSVLSHVLTYE